VDASYLVKNSAEIPSPALLVYVDKFQENLKKAIDLAGSVDRLRPHTKTHKLDRLVRLKMKAGVSKFKCATLAEAELLARCQAPDVLIAYPIVGPAVGRLINLLRAYPGTEFTVLADDEGPIQDLSAAMTSAGLVIRVMLDLDVGMHRTGLPPGEEAVRLYQLIETLPGLLPGGLHGYDGHLVQTDVAERCQAAAACRGQVLGLKDKVEKLNLSVPRVVVGGTPTFPCHAAVDGLELSPGTIFFMDYFYRQRIPDLDFQPSALILSRIISKPTPTLITLDTGSKAIAADPVGDRGRILNLEYNGFYRQSEEHWTIEVPDSGRLRLGQEVYILPTHICPTFAWQQEVYAIDGQGRCYDTWPVIARDRRLSV